MRTSRACVLASIVVLAGCQAQLVSGSKPPQSPPDANAQDASHGTDAPPSGYHATAVRFDPNHGDYLSSGPLAHAPAGSRKGTFSLWLRFEGGDGQAQTIAAATEFLSGGVTRAANGHIQFTFNQCVGPIVLQMQTQNTYATGSGWIHLLAAWDLDGNKLQIYVNGQKDLASNPQINDGSICYNAPNWYIGGTNNGATLDADVADIYASFDTFIDLDSGPNRAQFRSSSGKPVNLGASCANAYNGIVPIACFTGQLASWNTNKGTGGGMTVNGGGLSAAMTSPSD